MPTAFRRPAARAVWLRGLGWAVAAWALCAAPALRAQTPASVPAQPAISSDMGTVPFVPRDNGLEADWHRRGVFIEILVRAYQDTNGDGIGDLNGVTARLDYLKALGITGIWLMPVFRSEDRDHGYAVVNYREIEPDYGTLADFDRLLAEAHKRGIGVIVDYVINHSAASHPAFEAAFDSRKSPYNDWYIFKEEAEPGWNTFSGSPWREGNQRWYYGVFDARMPDFNLRNPDVIDFHLNNLRFWLNRGVDGFRFDAVGVLIENRAIAWENQPENHVVMKRMQDQVAAYGGRHMVCEAPSDPAAFAAATSCGSAFAFGLQKHIVSSVKIGRVRADLLSSLATLPVARMGTILANHDYFAGARLARQFAGDDKAYRLAVATLLTLPGMPFLYYGEEIGLGQSEPVQFDDQAIRGPMSWSAEPQGGFTTAAQPFRPLVANWKTNNAAAQQADAGSLWHWYRQLIALRRAHPALSIGTMKVLSQRDDPVLAFVREHDGQRWLVAINYAAREAAIDVAADITAANWTPVWPAAAASPLVPKVVPKVKPKAGTKPGPGTGQPTKPVPPAGLELRLGPQQVVILRQAG